MVLTLGSAHEFQRDAVVRVDAHLVAGFQVVLEQAAPTLQHQRLRAVVLADAQAVVADDLRDLGDGAGVVVPQVAHHHVGFVHEHAGSLLEFGDGDARIDVAIIIGPAYDDLHGFLARRAEERADAVRRAGHLLDDLLHLFDGLAGFVDGVFLVGDLDAQVQESLAHGVAHGERGDGAVEKVQGGLILGTAVTSTVGGF